MKTSEQLQEILKTMNVPEARKTDFFWLNQNLGRKNSQHPKFLEATRLILILIKDKKLFPPGVSRMTDFADAMRNLRKGN